MNIDFITLKSFMALVEDMVSNIAQFGILLSFLLLFYFGYFKKRRPVFLWKFIRQIESKILEKKFNAVLEAEDIKSYKKLLVNNALIKAKSIDITTKTLALQQLAQFDTEDAFNGLYQILITESDYTSRKHIIITLSKIIRNIEKKNTSSVNNWKDDL